MINTIAKYSVPHAKYLVPHKLETVLLSRCLSCMYLVVAVFDQTVHQILSIRGRSGSTMADLDHQCKRQEYHGRNSDANVTIGGNTVPIGTMAGIDRTIHFQTTTFALQAALFALLLFACHAVDSSLAAQQSSCRQQTCGEMLFRESTGQQAPVSLLLHESHHSSRSCL